MISDATLNLTQYICAVSSIAFITTIFINYFKNRHKIRINKENNIDESIESIPDSILERFSQNSKEMFDADCQKILDEFKETIKNELGEKYLEYFNQNIEKVTFNEVVGGPDDIEAAYVDDNEISILNYQNENNKYDISNFELLRMNLAHELLHIASRPPTNKTCGFRKEISDENGEIDYEGLGLNEGYTEYLNLSLFKNKYHSYNYLVNVSFLLEMIVGRDKMLDLYFNNNFDGFKEEFKKYSSKEDVNHFIELTDDLYKVLRLKDVDLNEFSFLEYDIYVNLFRMYLTKLIQENRYNENSAIEFINYFNSPNSTLIQLNLLDKMNVHDYDKLDSSKDENFNLIYSTFLEQKDSTLLK